MSSIDPVRLLTILQHGDSQFPGGGFAFSWGLEELWQAGELTSEGLAQFIHGQWQGRWYYTDRLAVARAYGCGDDLDAIAAVDNEIEAMLLGHGQRSGSRRAGRSLLAAHARLATPLAAAYRQRIRDAQGLGHLGVVQGLVWRGVGLTLADALVVSAYTFTSGLLVAAVRLGIIGAAEQQRILTTIIDQAAAWLIDPPTAERPLSACPHAEIAMLRHEGRAPRLFAT